MTNAPLVSAEERKHIREDHTAKRCPDGCGAFPCPTIRLLDALEAAEREVKP